MRAYDGTAFVDKPAMVYTPNGWAQRENKGRTADEWVNTNRWLRLEGNVYFESTTNVPNNILDMEADFDTENFPIAASGSYVAAVNRGSSESRLQLGVGSGPTNRNFRSGIGQLNISSATQVPTGRNRLRVYYNGTNVIGTMNDNVVHTSGYNFSGTRRKYCIGRTYVYDVDVPNASYQFNGKIYNVKLGTEGSYANIVPVYAGETIQGNTAPYDGLYDLVSRTFLTKGGTGTATYGTGGVDWNGLAASYQFEEGSYTGATGEVLDTAGVQNGTWNGTILPPEPGVRGLAASFNGVDSGVVLDPFNLSSNGSFTISGWVYPKSAKRGVLLGNYPNNPNLNAEINANGSLRFYWAQGNIDTATPANAAPLNQWTHFAFVRDVPNNRVRIYANGVALRNFSGIGTSLDLTSLTLRMGKDYRGGSVVSLDGLLDEVNIFGRALTTSEISSLYQS